MKYQTLGKYIVLEAIKEEEKTKSGIILVQRKKFTDADGAIRYGKGRVISIGDKVLTEWDTLKEKDLVMYNRADAHKIDLDADIFVVDCAGVQVKIND